MTVRTFREEGGDSSSLVKLIRTIGENDAVIFRLGTVVTAPPNVTIKVDGVEVTQEADDLLFAQHLTEHTRKVEINEEGGATTEADITYELDVKAGDRLLMLAYENDGGYDYVVIDKVVRF